MYSCSGTGVGRISISWTSLAPVSSTRASLGGETRLVSWLAPTAAMKARLVASKCSTAAARRGSGTPLDAGRVVGAAAAHGASSSSSRAPPACAIGYQASLSRTFRRRDRGMSFRARRRLFGASLSPGMCRCPVVSEPVTKRPQEFHGADRTLSLRNCVRVGNLSVGGAAPSCDAGVISVK